MWSLNLNIVQYFGCFTVDLPTAKLIGYMREPLELFMMTTSQLLINYLPWTNLSVFIMKISRDSQLKLTRPLITFLGKEFFVKRESPISLRSKPELGILEFLDFGRKSWTLDSEHWTLDAGLWTLDSERSTLDVGLWTLDAGS